MGQNNRQRRAAKQRKRSHRATGAEQDARFGQSDRPPFNEPECDCLACHVDADPAAAWRDAAMVLTATVAAVWSNGWQPSELVRQAGRAVSRESSHLLKVAILVDDAHRPASSKHPRWQSQINQLRSSVDPPSLDATWIFTWRDSAVDPIKVFDATMVALTSLGAVHRLIPPPGETAVDAGFAGGDSNDPILAKVRALLAQAESTDFPAEAETFTAKAQAMMSKHAIDEAMVRDASGATDRPVTIRLPIDDPYSSEKATLLHVVAEAGRCRSISFAAYGLASLTGQAADVYRVELLFTSLLLQAQSALNHEAAAGVAGAHRRSRAFRSAFLAGYAVRIGDRLAAERDHAEEKAGPAVVVVLARQSDAVDDEIERLYGGNLRHQGHRSRDRAGWNAGSDAADRAQLRDAGVQAGNAAASAELAPPS